MRNPLKRDGLAGVKLPPDDIERLRKAKLTTRAELVAKAAADGLGPTAVRTLVDPHLLEGKDADAANAVKEGARERLRDALAASFLAEKDGTDRSRLRRGLARITWLEPVLLLLLALVAFGVWRALQRPERQVVAARELYPFQVLAPGDVRVDTTFAAFGTFSDPGAVVGRFPLRVVQPGDPLVRSGLSAVRGPRLDELEGRRIVSLPVPAQSAALAVPRTRVTLLLSPRERRGDASEAAVLTDVIVLDRRVSGDTSSIVVALPGDSSVATLARALAASQVYVVQQVEARTANH